jgi:hypothetical protein
MMRTFALFCLSAMPHRVSSAELVIRKTYQLHVDLRYQIPIILSRGSRN